MGGSILRRACVCLTLCCVVLCSTSTTAQQVTTEELYVDRYDLPSSSLSPKDPFATSAPGSELRGGLLSGRKMRVDKGEYFLREDLIVDTGAELIIEAGVRISFGPTVGITVRGILTAK
ncbi:unnamed protein product, partial [Nesidiocoris tenuis]